MTAATPEKHHEADKSTSQIHDTVLITPSRFNDASGNLDSVSNCELDRTDISQFYQGAAMSHRILDQQQQQDTLNDQADSALANVTKLHAALEADDQNNYNMQTNGSIAAPRGNAQQQRSAKGSMLELRRPSKLQVPNIKIPVNNTLSLPSQASVDDGNSKVPVKTKKHVSNRSKQHSGKGSKAPQKALKPNLHTEPSIQVEQSPPALQCNAWIISDPHEHSFSYTYQALLMHRMRLCGTRKIVQMEDLVRSVRPYSFENATDGFKSELKEQIMRHLRPLVNVIYTKGSYYIYQAESLMRQPGLTTDLGEKSKGDRFFVTNQIKNISMKASIVVRDAKVPELQQAIQKSKLDKKALSKLKKRGQSEYSEEEDEWLDPMKHELKAEGVILRTGDVIRLGRVCYIVKESSIDLNEEALKMAEAYAEMCNKSEWERINSPDSPSKHSNSIIGGNSQSHQNARAVSNQSGSPPKEDAAQSNQTGFYDAVEDYFNTVLAGRQNSNESINNVSGLHGSYESENNFSQQSGAKQQSVSFKDQRRGHPELQLRQQSTVQDGHGGGGRRRSTTLDSNFSRSRRPLFSDTNLVGQQDLVQKRLESKIQAFENHKQDKTCRICFGGEEEDANGDCTMTPDGSGHVKLKNPLLSPCNCTGSSQYIHLECLQQWLGRQKTVYRYEESSTTIYKISSCELCNTKYPDQVNLNGEKYGIFSVERPVDMPYLILEVLGMPEGKNLKVIGVPRDRVIVLGRSNTCDLIINDQSISNKHAKIFFSVFINKFILQDFNSKFGTLKVIQQPLKVYPNQKTYVQVGCTVLQFGHEDKRKQTRSCFDYLCCKLSGNKQDDPIEKLYMKKTINPKDPVIDEVARQEAEESSSTQTAQLQTFMERSRPSDRPSDKLISKHDFKNFPDAIPPEVFVYFFEQQMKDKRPVDTADDYESSSFKERRLNWHFMVNHYKVMDQQKEKEVYLHKGFTQRNQRMDQTEEKLRTEILSDFNEFESINREAESVLAGHNGSINSPALPTSIVSKLKQRAETVLRMKITPEKVKEPNDKFSFSAGKRSGSMLIARNSLAAMDANSPLDVLSNGRNSNVKNGRLRSNSDAFLTLHERMSARQNGVTSLEQIEEELARIKHRRKHPQHDSGSKLRQRNSVPLLLSNPGNASGEGQPGLPSHENIHVEQMESSNDSVEEEDDDDDDDDEEEVEESMEEEDEEVGSQSGAESPKKSARDKSGQGATKPTDLQNSQLERTGGSKASQDKAMRSAVASATIQSLYEVSNRKDGNQHRNTGAESVSIESSQESIIQQLEHELMQADRKVGMASDSLN